MHGVFSAGEIKLAFHFSSGQLSSWFNKRCWSKQNFAWSPAQTNTQAAYGTNFVLFAQFSQVQGFSQFSCPYLIAPPPSRLALLPIFNFLPLLLLVAAFSSVDSRDLRSLFTYILLRHRILLSLALPSIGPAGSQHLQPSHLLATWYVKIAGMYSRAVSFVSWSPFCHLWGHSLSTLAI